MTKKKLSLIGLILIVVPGTMFGLFELCRMRSYQVFGEIVPRVETDRKIIALTFDDGPSPGFTDEILKILEEEGVKATFFLIGNDLEKNPAEGRKIAQAGHEIGNHSFSHVRMMLVSTSFVRDEIEKTDSLIRAGGYDQPIHFRPPFGKKLFTLPWYLSQNNRKTITWDVEPESFDDTAKSTDAITAHILERTRPGSIILLHVMYDRERRSLNAVRPAIRGLKEKGYEFVTVSNLLTNRSN